MEFTPALPSLHGRTLIIPSVSVGNGAQLAVDAFLHTIGAQLMANGDHSALTPVVGCSEDAQIITAMQLYTIKNNDKLIIMQVRAPLIPGHTQKFVQDLIAWSDQQKIHHIVCLASAYSQNLHVFNKDMENQDIQEAMSAIYCDTNENSVEEEIKKLAFRPLAFSMEEPEKTPQSRTNYIPLTQMAMGWGFYGQFARNARRVALPYTALIMLCAESDNSIEAMILADALQRLLHLRGLISDQRKLEKPPTWALAYGHESEYSSSIYL